MYIFSSKFLYFSFNTCESKYLCLLVELTALEKSQGEIKKRKRKTYIQIKIRNT